MICLPHNPEAAPPLPEISQEARDWPGDTVLDRLAAALRYWKDRLRLRDWDFTLEVPRHYDMLGPNNIGASQVEAAERHVRIRIRHPLDHPPDAIDRERDLECTLVHELLHVYMDPLGIPDRGPRHLAVEVVISTMAAALVGLRREAAVVRPLENLRVVEGA